MAGSSPLLHSAQMSALRTLRTYAIVANAGAESRKRCSQLRQRNFGGAAIFPRPAIRWHHNEANPNRPFATVCFGDSRHHALSITETPTQFQRKGDVLVNTFEDKLFGSTTLSLCNPPLDTSCASLASANASSEGQFRLSVK